MQDNLQENLGEDLTVYELGFHIAPNISEEVVGNVVETLKKGILDLGGNIASEEAPKLVPLAYAIGKHEKAYFGWVKFEMEPGNISKLNVFTQARKEVVRFLIIKSDKENSIHYHKISAPKKESTSAPEDLDKSIEELVIS
jgi:ribosomal protein S6